jgi:hypothetical protein
MLADLIENIEKKISWNLGRNILVYVVIIIDLQFTLEIWAQSIFYSYILEI